MMDMISFLSLRTTGPQDMFLFYVTGQTAAAKEQAGQKQCNPAKGQGSMKVIQWIHEGSLVDWLN